MTDTYKGGYKKALLDILNYIDNPDPLFHPLGASVCKSKKQYTEQLKRTLTILLSNPLALDNWMDGLGVFKISPKGELLDIIK